MTDDVDDFLTRSGGVLHDYAVSKEAMRWAPDPADLPEPCPLHVDGPDRLIDLFLAWARGEEGARDAYAQALADCTCDTGTRPASNPDRIRARRGLAHDAALDVFPTAPGVPYQPPEDYGEWSVGQIESVSQWEWLLAEPEAFPAEDDHARRLRMFRRFLSDP
jgi:hypothetical protein